MRAVAWAGFALIGCASVSPLSYSLQDPEIFIASRPHFLNLAVAVLEDRRPPEEKVWASRLKRPSPLSHIVTERVVEHLRVSSVFSRVQTVSRPLDPAFSDRLRELASQGVDAVLIGELAHFYGRRYPDRRIEGHVQFANLRLIGTRTGQLLWQGATDKLLERQEKEPGPDEDYASEALRGAINQLTMQLAKLSFTYSQVYSSEQPEMRHWRVGVLLPEDLRPAQEKDVGVRELQGNLNYLLYSDTARSADKPFLCGVVMKCSPSIWEAAAFIGQVPDEWVKKLQENDLFEEALSIKSREGTAEELREWSEEGLDAVLASRLSHSFGSVTPPYNQKPFPILSGGIGFQRSFKATALTRIEEVQLIDTRSGRVIWKGEAEYGIDRTIRNWESPMKLVQESLDETLNRLVKQLSKFISSPEENPSPSDGAKDLSRP